VHKGHRDATYLLVEKVNHKVSNVCTSNLIKTISNCVANKVCKVKDGSLFFDLDMQGHLVTSSVVESEGELTNEFKLTTRL